MGFVGVFVHHLLQGYGLQTATAVHSGWLIALIPIWSAVLSVTFKHERFGLLRLAGLAGGFIGAMLVITRGTLTTDMLRLPETRGDLLMLISTLNWAVYSVLGHNTIKRLGSTRATAGAMLLGWLMVGVVFVGQKGWSEMPRLSGTGWAAVIFLGLGSSGVGYLAWYSALARLEVSRVASFLYLQPLVTLAAAVVSLGESVHATTVLGGLVVLFSVYLMNRASPPSNRAEPAAD
jgi:drug/metabolite transporter (DMT)-like permease